MTTKSKALPVETLEDDIRRICGVFDLIPTRNGGMVKGSMNARRIGHFDAAVVALEMSIVDRNKTSIRRDPGEHFFLLVQNAGQCRVRQDQTIAELSPGDMFLVDSSRPSSFDYGDSQSDQISFHIPRDEIVHRFGQHCRGGVAISRFDPLSVALLAVIRKMMSQSGGEFHLSEALMSLLGAILHSRHEGSTPLDPQTILARALAIIDRHRADPTFGPGDIAARLNVPARMLQRHFRVFGETPGHRLLTRRLELARARLSTIGLERGAESITTVAFDCGFNDLSYFYREFRKKYGVKPGDVVKKMNV